MRRRFRRFRQKLHARRYAVRDLQQKRAGIVLFCVAVCSSILLRLPVPDVTRLQKSQLERKTKEENRLFLYENEQFEQEPFETVKREGSVLVVASVKGGIENLTPVEDEETQIDVKINLNEILKQRFGDLTNLDFRSFFTNYYIEDSSTSATKDLFSVEKFLTYDFAMEKKKEAQILIYHTHGSEAYNDSKPGKEDDTVIGAGEVLAKELREKYGFQVIHLTTLFDRKPDGSDDRDNSYNNSLPVIKEILKENKEIEVIIDLHRDSGEARTSVINGTKMAKIMLFNGLCRTKTGPITYYNNENLPENLAFSFCTQITGNELFPFLMHRTYLKSYRYNMHLTGKYLLVELGTEKNSVSEAKSAMKPFAKVLATVLSGGVIPTD